MIDLSDPAVDVTVPEPIPAPVNDIEYVEDDTEHDELFQAVQLLVATKYVLLFLLGPQLRAAIRDTNIPNKIWREAVKVEKDVNKFLQQWQDQREMEAVE